MSDSDDAKLKKLFAELKAEDERQAPSFAATWLAAARTGEKPGRVRWLAPAAVAATLALAATVLAVWFLGALRPSEPVQEASLPVTITQWESPTDFLLTTLDTTLLTTTPSLDQSWMNDLSYLTERFE